MSTRFLLALFLFSFCFIISFSHALNNGFSVELIHRDSPKSPLYQPIENRYQRLVNAARRSINRANHFYKDSLANTPKSTVIPDKGDLSVETLTLESTTGRPVSFPKTVIGCGTDNTVSFQGASSGIVGLGGGPASLITQLGSSIDGKFSYCLLPLLLESNTAESTTTSKLNFGDVAVVSGDGVVSTPIVKKNPSVFYYLTLEAFSVGNKRVEFGGSASGDEGNIIIDSGTTLTLLPSDVYTNLESAVVESVKLERVDDPNQTFGLCYSVTSDGYDFPLITAHFKGADVKLHSMSTFVPIADGIVCLAFTSSQIGAIFGNLAQQNLLVGYDLKQKTVSFKPMDCTKV
ncbi:hypothetical protein P8452_50889 [Trifolium repens]|nr:hypothetical protein P8452_50889 [Trifolium repens]